MKIIQNNKVIAKAFYPNIVSGEESFFIGVNHFVGLKLFHGYFSEQMSLEKQKAAATHSYKRQLLYNQHTRILAPKPFSEPQIFELIPKDIQESLDFFCTASLQKRIFFGYHTEIANINKKITLRAKNELIRYLKLNKIVIPDMHDGNLGYINNNIVCIDFGDISFLSEKCTSIYDHELI